MPGQHTHPMSVQKKKWIRRSYVTGQWISVFCAFAGTLFSLYDYRHPDMRKPDSAGDIFLNFGVAFCAASIAAYTANKFQGTKIGGAHQDHNAPAAYPYHQAARTRKSNRYEAAYLSFATTLLLVDNYFLLAAIKAESQALKNPGKIYPLLPLSTTSFIILAFKVLAVDLIFNTTNAHYETAAEIKKACTDSKAGPLVSQLCLPFATGWRYTITIAWIKTVGVLFHTATDYLGLMLSIPPTAFIYLYQTPHLFWPIMIVGAISSSALLFVNYIQTLYFEAKESEVNLKRLQEQNAIKTRHYLKPSKNKSSFLRSLLTWNPNLRKPIRYGFFTQAPLHAAGDVMPVILFMRDFFDRFEWNTGAESVAIALCAAVVLISSTLGTYESEVKTALHHYDRDFSDIGTSHGMTQGV